MISRVKWILFLFALLSTSAEDASSSDHILNIAVIGGGAAGLASAKNILEQGHKVVIFEKSGALGGTWWYTDQIGKDEFGVDIHSAIYYTLRYSKLIHIILQQTQKCIFEIFLAA